MITGDGGPMGANSGEGMQIMGFGADPTLIPAQKAPWEQTGTQTAANAQFVANQQGKNTDTNIALIVAGVLVLGGGFAIYKVMR